MTKIELQQANTRLAKENDELRHQLSHLQAKYDLRVQQHCDDSIENAQLRKTLSRREAMEHARQQAILGKRVVKV